MGGVASRAAVPPPPSGRRADLGQPRVPRHGRQARRRGTEQERERGIARWWLRREKEREIPGMGEEGEVDEEGEPAGAATVTGVASF
jgi:hypothetical protein